MLLTLSPHPNSASRSSMEVRVQVERTQEGGLSLEYFVSGADALALPPTMTPDRADQLWTTTCFELFFKRPGSQGYYEFNFSPSFRWAAYSFDGYRSGMRTLAAENPEISITPAGDHFFLAAEPGPSELLRGAGAVGLAAVIEEKDGTKSYWALKHPPGDPDFHHPDCFALELPAAKSA